MYETSNPGLTDKQDLIISPNLTISDTTYPSAYLVLGGRIDAIA